VLGCMGNLKIFQEHLPSLLGIIAPYRRPCPCGTGCAGHKSPKTLGRAEFQRVESITSNSACAPSHTVPHQQYKCFCPPLSHNAQVPFRRGLKSPSGGLLARFLPSQSTGETTITINSPVAIVEIEGVGAEKIPYHRTHSYTILILLAGQSRSEGLLSYDFHCLNSSTPGLCSQPGQQVSKTTQQPFTSPPNG